MCQMLCIEIDKFMNFYFLDKSKKLKSDYEIKIRGTSRKSFL